MSELRVARFGLIQGREDFRAFFATWKIWFLAWGVRSIFAAAMIALLGRMIGSDEQVYYLLIGNAVIVGAHSAAWAIQSSTWDRWDGTYALLVVSPYGLRPSIIGRSAIWVFSGVITSLTTFAGLALIFRMPLPFPGALFVPVIIAGICVSAYAFGLAIGAFVMRVPRARNIVHSFAMTIIAAFTGVNVPVSFWPPWVETVAMALPVTHGLAALRALLASAPASGVAGDLGLELVVAALWFAFAWFAMNVMANAGRADGSIDFAGI
jgi:ABC-2 type transport system permease protein